jgi:hypothetical protein
MTKPQWPPFQIEASPSIVYSPNSITLRALGQLGGYDLQWIRNGDPIPGATNGTLTVVPTQIGNYQGPFWNESGNYSLGIRSNGVMVTSPETNIVFKAPPLATILPPTNAIVGTGFRLDARVPWGGTFEWHWMLDGKSITETRHETNFYGYLNSLNLGVIQASTPRGPYSIATSNEAGSWMSEAVWINVNTQLTLVSTNAAIPPTNGNLVASQNRAPNGYYYALARGNASGIQLIKRNNQDQFLWSKAVPSLPGGSGFGEGEHRPRIFVTPQNDLYLIQFRLGDVVMVRLDAEGVEREIFQTQNFGGPGFALMSADGRLFLNDSGVLLCFRERALLWRRAGLFSIDQICVDDKGNVYIADAAGLEKWDPVGTRIWNTGSVRNVIAGEVRVEPGVNPAIYLCWVDGEIWQLSQISQPGLPRIQRVDFIPKTSEHRINISATVTSIDPVTIQWYRDGKVIPEATGPVLLADAPVPRNAYPEDAIWIVPEFSFTVSNSAGTVSSGTFRPVPPPAVFMERPSGRPKLIFPGPLISPLKSVIYSTDLRSWHLLGQPLNVTNPVPLELPTGNTIYFRASEMAF